MQKKNDNFLEKIVKKDYNNELEAILEKKYFNEDVKSILLNILYKIETAYKDYKKVKQDTETKDEYIEKIIDKMKKDNDKKLEKIDNTADIKEIMKELKKINAKYDKMAEKIAKNNTNIRNTTSNKIKPKKDNIIKITELKDKLNKQELVIEFGKEIEYEQLLNTAIDTYEIKPNKKSKKA